MHPLMFDAFEEICGRLAIAGRVLEIGASPHHQSLLGLPSLRGASERIGVGLDGDMTTKDWRIINRNAHDLSCFAEGSFDLVLCNSMLEHDGQFWLTLGEARRVTAMGGWMVFGVPAFGAMGTVPRPFLSSLLAKLPLATSRWRQAGAAAAASSPTLGLHDYPADYYRFSEAALRDIILDGLDQIETRLILAPPRAIGCGRKREPGQS